MGFFAFFEENDWGNERRNKSMGCCGGG